tara:strand:+ start:202 stop:510 length:309 start_codon:yes stop_codon:yes gene_type:complete
MDKTQVEFNGIRCNVDTQQMYKNNRRSINLTDMEDGTPVLTASINIPMEELDNDEVIIKNYSENEGILEALIEARIVSEPVDYANVSKFVTAPICKLLIPAI